MTPEDCIAPETWVLAAAFGEMAKQGMDLSPKRRMRIANAISNVGHNDAALILGAEVLAPTELGFVWKPAQECPQAFLDTREVEVCAAVLILHDRLGKLPPLFDLKKRPVSIETLRAMFGAI